MLIILFVAPLFVIWATFGPLAYRCGRNGFRYTFMAIALFILGCIGCFYLRPVVARYMRLPYWIRDY